MPISLAGFVKNRKHQFGRQSVFNTKVAAARVYPFKGVPAPDPQWTDPDIDVGSIDPVEAPYREGGNYPASLTDPSVRYNNLPLMLAAAMGGEVNPSGAGAAQTWDFVTDHSTGTTPDPMTYEFGDDVTTDWYQFGDGVLQSLEITGPEGLGACSASMSWMFGSAAGSGFTDFAASPSVPTDLSLVPNEAILYLKDAKIAIASDPDDLSTSQISDALHTFTLRINNTIDEKRFANGDQSFDADAFAVSARAIELECTFAKTADIVGTGSESDAWFSESAVDRYVQITFTSKVVAETGMPDVPYSLTLTMPLRYYTRTEGEVGGNTVVVLTGHAFYHADDGTIDEMEALEAVLVNTIDETGI